MLKWTNGVEKSLGLRTIMFQLKIYVKGNELVLNWTTVRLLGNPRLFRRPRPFVINVHNFMDAAQLDTPEGRARLKACVFKVPVDGEMVSMCEFNGGGLRATQVARRTSAETAKPR